MKKFVLKLLIFCIVPMAVLMPLAHIVDAGLRKSRHFYYAEWNDLFDGKINADMLIMGTSRAWVHFSPQILDSGLKLNSYNLGMDAAPFSMQYDRFKIYLRYNKKPKFILQEVGFNTTLILSRSLPLYQQFLPYLYDTAMWRIYKEQYDRVNFADRYFPLYKYNNALPVVKEGIWNYFGRGRPAVKYKGYLGQERPWDSSFHDMVQSNPDGIKWKIDPNAINVFRNYLQYCNDNGIKLILVYTPFYYEMDKYIINHHEVKSTLKALANEYHVPLLDYTHNYLDSNKAYYYNSQHLNKYGSELFSHMLVQDVYGYVMGTTAALHCNAMVNDSNSTTSVAGGQK